MQLRLRHSNIGNPATQQSGISWSQYWATHWASTYPWDTTVLADMSDESNFSLTNSEFSTEQHHSGSKSIKMNIPAGGSSIIEYEFADVIDLRLNTLSFKLMAIDENVADVTLFTLKLYLQKVSGGADIITMTSGTKIGAFRPLESWVTENITDRYVAGTHTTLFNEYAYLTKMYFKVEADSDVVIYFDTISIHPQENRPTSILLSADDGYEGWIVDAAAIANSYNIKLSAAVVKDFIESGSHSIGGVVRSTANYTQLLAFQAAGNEVCNHSKTHPNITALTEAQLIDETITWSNELIARGFDRVSAKVWIPPNGGINDLSANVVHDYMIMQRNPRLFNEYGVMGLVGYDVYSLSSQIFEDFDATDVDSLFSSLPKENILLILYGHAIYDDGGTPGAYATHIDVLERICQKMSENNIKSVTYKDLYHLNQMNENRIFDQETYQDYAEVDQATFLANNIYIEDTQFIWYDSATSGTTLIDKSGSGIDGTMTNIGTATEPQRIIKTAAASKVSLPTANYIGNSEFTIIMAFKVVVIPTVAYQPLFLESRTGSAFFRVAVTLETDGDIELKTRTTATEGISMTSNIDTVVGDWVIVAFRRDTTTLPGTTYLKGFWCFENGKRRTGTASYVGTSIANTQPDKIEIFESTNGAGNEIGDLIIYKKLLTDAEVLATVRKLNEKYNFQSIL